MITIRDVLESVALRLHTESGAVVYKNRCPVDFERPSFWIELVKRTIEPATFSTVQVDVEIVITCFIPVDEYGNSDDMALTDVQDAVHAMFFRHPIQIGGRELTPGIQYGGLDPENSSSDVTLNFSYFDDRPAEETPAEMMENVELSIREGENNGAS